MAIRHQLSRGKPHLIGGFIMLLGAYVAWDILSAIGVPVREATVELAALAALAVLVYGAWNWIEAIRLRIYYEFFLDRCYRTLRDWEKNHRGGDKLARACLLILRCDPWVADLTLKSVEFAKYLKEQGKLTGHVPPLFLRDCDLDSSYVPHHLKAFSILVLFGDKDVTIAKNTDGSRALSISAPRTGGGIYHNWGKKFLEQQYLQDTEVKAKLTFASTDLHKNLLGCGRKDQPNGEIFSLGSLHTQTGIPVPLRWASGGVLPVATFKNKEWFLLFFRDIKPRGWNVANGASENMAEFHDLSRLIEREATEEVVVLDGAIPLPPDPPLRLDPTERVWRQFINADGKILPLGSRNLGGLRYPNALIQKRLKQDCLSIRRFRPGSREAGTVISNANDTLDRVEFCRGRGRKPPPVPDVFFR